MMSVSIIGCGWLGQVLAQRLLASGSKVLASYQSPKSYEKLHELNIPNCQLILPIIGDVASYRSLDDLTAFDRELFEQDVMIIAIPPQLKKGRVDYPLKIQQLVHLAELGKTKHIILLNSTAIYNGLSGNVDETTPLDLNAEKVSSLLAAEQALKAFTKRTHILRLAGLVGPNRHPGKFLQAARIFTNASAAVNLVHQEDVVNILIQLIEHTDTGCEQSIYNVVSNTDSDRQHYYQTAAQALHLPQPQFALEAEVASGKKIIGTKLREQLAYHYQHDDLLTWLSDSSDALAKE